MNFNVTPLLTKPIDPLAIGDNRPAINGALDLTKGFKPGDVPKPKVSAGLVNMGVQLGTMAGNMAQFGAKQVGTATRQAYKFDGMSAGASIGTTLGGPVGTAVGAGLGALYDFYNYKKGDAAFKGQMYAENFGAWRDNQKEDLSRKDYTGMYRSGGKVPIEVEGKEIGILKQGDGSFKEVFRTGDNVKPHEEGGKQMKVPEGTEVFNAELFDQVDTAMKSKDWKAIETKLIPARDEILEKAKAEGDPYSTGKTTEEAEGGETAMEEAFNRSGGKATFRFKAMKFAATKSSQFKIVPQKGSASEKPQVAMNSNQFKGGMFKRSENKVFARGGGHIRKPIPSGGSRMRSPAKMGSGGVAVKTVDVKQGDSLSRIAKANNVSLSEMILANNDIGDINKIEIGQKIVIPQTKEKYSEKDAITAWDKANESKRLSLEPNRAKPIIADASALIQKVGNIEFDSNKAVEGEEGSYIVKDLKTGSEFAVKPKEDGSYKFYNPLSKVFLNKVNRPIVRTGEVEKQENYYDKNPGEREKNARYAPMKVPNDRFLESTAIEYAFSAKGAKGSLQKLGDIEFDSDKARSVGSYLIVKDKKTGKDFAVERKSDGTYSFHDTGEKKIVKMPRDTTGDYAKPPIRTILADRGSKAKMRSGGIVKAGSGTSVPYGVSQGEKPYGLLNNYKFKNYEMDNTQSVPDGMAQKFFGGQSFGVENALSTYTSPQLKAKAIMPLPTGANRAITGLPKQSYGDAALTVAKHYGKEAMNRAGDAISNMKNPDLYDKATVYGLGAAAINASQRDPSYQRMQRVAMARVQYDDTALKAAEQNNTAQGNQVLSAFGKSVRGVGSLMGVAANVAKNGMDANNQIAIQRSSAINQTASQNAQISGQESSMNTQIANQEILTNVQMQAQNAQLKAQNVKANTDAAFQAQFQKQQLGMQQEAIKKQREIQGASLKYMSDSDRYYQAVSSTEASSHVVSRFSEEDKKITDLLGDSADKFMMLRSDDASLKSVLDKRDKAVADYDKKGGLEVDKFFKTSKEEYDKTATEIANFEAGKGDFGGMKKEMDEAKRKEQAKAAREALDAGRDNNYAALHLTPEEIAEAKTGKFDSAINSIKSKARSMHVKSKVYETEIAERQRAIRANAHIYRRDYAKSIGINEPNSEELLKYTR